MTPEEARTILLLHRPDGADADDPQIVEALALAKSNPELQSWLDKQSAQQSMLSEKFRQIPVPAGLREQIISEQAANNKAPLWQREMGFKSVAVVVLLAGLVAIFWFSQRESADTAGSYQNQMVGVALSGYAMDLRTNEVVAIRAYLAANKAPADFAMSAALQQATITGCAMTIWQGGKVSLICFRTANSTAPEGQNDLWLFVADGTSVKNAPVEGTPQFSKVDQIITATWIQEGKVYLLGIQGDEQTLRRYL